MNRVCKLLSVVLSLMLVLTVVGCSGGQKSSDSMTESAAPYEDEWAKYHYEMGEYLRGQAKDAAAAGTTAEGETNTEAMALFAQAGDNYLKAIELAPDHPLTPRVINLAGQCYISAGQPDKAATVLALMEGKMASPEAAAQAGYWRADAELKQGNADAAYASFKAVANSYPETDWGQFASKRMSGEAAFESQREADAQAAAAAAAMPAEGEAPAEAEAMPAE